MPTPKEEALETLTSLKAEFDAAVKDAQEDGRRWKLLRHYTDPKGREDEFAGYAATATMAAGHISHDEPDAAKSQLNVLKARFDLAAIECRAAPMDFLESCFGIYAQEASRFEKFSQACEKVMKLV